MRVPQARVQTLEAAERLVPQAHRVAQGQAPPRSAGSGGSVIGGASGSAGSAGSAGASGASGSGGTAGASCVPTTVTVDANGVKLMSTDGSTKTAYYATFTPALGGSDPDYVLIRFVGSPSSIPAGSYNLGSVPYNQLATSPIEVMVAEDVTANGYGRLYFQYEGKLVLDVADTAALGSSKGSLQGVSVEEITVQGTQSTPVVDGKCITITDVAWDTTGGVCGTGFPIQNPNAQSCFEQNCCDPFTACVENETCAACYGTPSSQECQNNAMYQAASSCFLDSCTSPICNSGLVVQKPACATCLSSNCCVDATSCGNEPACKSCWLSGGQGAGCTTNGHLIAAFQCLQSNCSQECQ
ncbi:MAG: hypothetical protein U0165_03430 [Polyangiaceae bacterium]